MIPILLYSHSNEPLTKALISSTLDQKCGLIKLSVEELLHETCIIDELNNDKVKISWTLPSGNEILNSNDFYLINRVLSIPEDIFNSFSEEDRLYSISEFRAYLAFAIQAFPVSFSRPGAFGLSGNRFSLVRQWEMIKGEDFVFKTPKYYLGNMDFCPLEEDLVYTNPFDFYYWRPNQNVVDVDRASFVFSKPKGKPVVACIIGEDVNIFCYYARDEISSKTESYLKEQSLLILNLFNYAIAEILFFIEGDDFTFGMISNIPYASNKKNWFHEKTCIYFEEELRKYGKS